MNTVLYPQHSQLTKYSRPITKQYSAQQYCFVYTSSQVHGLSGAIKEVKGYNDTLIVLNNNCSQKSQRLGSYIWDKDLDKCQKHATTDSDNTFSYFSKKLDEAYLGDRTNSKTQKQHKLDDNNNAYLDSSSIATNHNNAQHDSNSFSDLDYINCEHDDSECYIHNTKFQCETKLHEGNDTIEKESSQDSNTETNQQSNGTSQSNGNDAKINNNQSNNGASGSNNYSSGSGNGSGSSSSSGGSSSGSSSSGDDEDEEEEDEVLDSSDNGSELFATVEVIDGTRKQKYNTKYWVQRNVVTIQVLSGFVFDTCYVYCHKEGSHDIKLMEKLSYVDSFYKLSQNKTSQYRQQVQNPPNEIYETQFRKKLPHTSGRPETQKHIWLSAHFYLNDRLLKDVQSEKFFVCSRPQDSKGTARTKVPAPSTSQLQFNHNEPVKGSTSSTSSPYQEKPNYSSSPSTPPSSPPQQQQQQQQQQQEQAQQHLHYHKPPHSRPNYPHTHLASPPTHHTIPSMSASVSQTQLANSSTPPTRSPHSDQYGQSGVMQDELNNYTKYATDKRMPFMNTTVPPAAKHFKMTYSNNFKGATENPFAYQDQHQQYSMQTSLDMRQGESTSVPLVNHPISSSASPAPLSHQMTPSPHLHPPHQNPQSYDISNIGLPTKPEQIQSSQTTTLQDQILTTPNTKISSTDSHNQQQTNIANHSVETSDAQMKDESSQEGYNFSSQGVQPPVIHYIQPISGSKNGGEQVAIFGEFYSLPNSKEYVRVLFGLQDSPHIDTISNDKIVCQTPDRLVSGSVTVQIITNTKPQLRSNTDVYYRYY